MRPRSPAIKSSVRRLQEGRKAIRPGKAVDRRDAEHTEREMSHDLDGDQTA